jgi:acyl carrier protein
MNLPDWLVDPTRKARSEISSRFSGRTSLSDSEYYAQFFSNSKISSDIVARVRKVFSVQLGEEFRLLYPDDDWTKEFQVIWSLDSMADVELVLALEDEFKVSISEQESARMKCLRAVIEIINEKE